MSLLALLSIIMLPLIIISIIISIISLIALQLLLREARRQHATRGLYEQLAAMQHVYY